MVRYAQTETPFFALCLSFVPKVSDNIRFLNCMEVIFATFDCKVRVLGI